MDTEAYQEDTQPNSLGKLYYAGVASFIFASGVLAVWAFATLALAR